MNEFWCKRIGFCMIYKSFGELAIQSDCLQLIGKERSFLWQSFFIQKFKLYCKGDCFCRKKTLAFLVLYSNICVAFSILLLLESEQKFLRRCSRAVLRSIATLRIWRIPAWIQLSLSRRLCWSRFCIFFLLWSWFFIKGQKHPLNGVPMCPVELNERAKSLYRLKWWTMLELLKRCWEGLMLCHRRRYP